LPQKCWAKISQNVSFVALNVIAKRDFKSIGVKIKITLIEEYRKLLGMREGESLNVNELT
jgi:hypothetical protein